MADQWPGTPESDQWPGTPELARSPASPPALLPQGFVSPAGRAIDGDTIIVNNGPHLRLWGVDAPESRQLGLDIATGRPVPIGSLATHNMTSAIQNSPLTIGPAVSTSYGREVAPVTAAGNDLGLTLLRNGSALAVPSYLNADPTRQFDYVQAERLARQNGLGIHNTVFQQPADFRHNPLPVEDLEPQRETYARWWDTPTRDNGMAPETERQFVTMMNDEKVPVTDVVAFAKAHGFITDPDLLARNRAYAKRTRQPIQLQYDQPRQVMTDPGDGAGGALARGLANGVLPNMLEEAGAVADTLGLTPGRENLWNSNRRFADIWANNEAQNESITSFDAYKHPWATTTGEVAGGLALPFGKVESAADLAKIGAAYGAVSGLGHPGSIPERLSSGVVGAGEGLATTVLGGKALDAAAPYVGKLLSPVAERFKVRENSQAIPMSGDAGSSIGAETSGPARPQPVDMPLTDAQRQVAADNIWPGDVLPIPTNEVGSAEEAAAINKGRFAPATAPNEKSVLDRGTVTNWMGVKVPKVGPTDMVGWLRLNGGLVDQGGELSHMGLTNAARRGMDFVGQEQRFGPLVNNDTGMNLDDAAMRAWEAGYFPDHTDRPSVNEFLDALRATYEGRSRNFLPEDLPQIDAFNAARDDRYALEQQRFETDHPVVADRSAPATEPAPFPPVHAYEEWPANGPDFAGNINLGKLDTPQDIKRALDTTDRRVGGFDAATRGRVTQAETQALASDLGMTPDALIARRKGQAFNAEEALAARQILAKSGNELVNLARKVRAMDEPGDDVLAQFRQAWMRHVAIQEQVAGMTAEAGRALQQFRMTADSRQVPGKVLSSLVGGAGGRKRLQDAAGVLLDAAETEPGKFNVLADKLSKPRWRDKAVELWYNILLSGPQTHAANIVSNTLTALGQFPEHVTAAGIGLGRRAVQGSQGATDRVYGSELGSRAFGLVQGIRDGVGEFVRAMRTGTTSDFASKIEAQSQPAISGLKGKIIRVPTHALSAEDEFFKAIARRMELNGLAARKAASEGLTGEAAAKRIAEITANPPDDMLERTFDYARYITFQRPLTGLPQTISSAAQRHPLLKFLIPFVRTPTNLMKFAVERSPAAPLLKEWRADFQAGGARRDLAVAKAMVGTGFAAWMADLATKGVITGSPPDDQNKDRLLRADGWQPYSLRVGDRYYSYNRLDPFAVSIATAADLATKRDNMTPRQLDQSTGLLVASLMKSMGDRTWLSGLSDFIGMLDDPQRNLPSYLKQQSASLVIPAVSAQIARTIDPVSRRADTIGDEFRSRIPGLSSSLPPRRDIWGRPITTERFGPDIISPITMTQRQNDPVDAEMLRLGATGTTFPKQHTVNGKRFDYTAAEYDRLSAAAGQAAHKRVAALIASPFWPLMSEDERTKEIAKAIKGARSNARNTVISPWPGAPISGHSKANAWPGTVETPANVGAAH